MFDHLRAFGMIMRLSRNMLRWSRVVACGIAAVLIYPSITVAQTQLIEFSTYYPGTHFSPVKSGLPEPLAIAVRSMDEWIAVWNKLHPIPSGLPLTVPGYPAPRSSQTDPEPPPFIDFTKFTLLIVASGAYNSSGHGVTITLVLADNGGIVVKVIKTAPGKGCGIIDTPTMPIAFSLIPKTESRIVFDIAEASVDCTTQVVKRVDASSGAMRSPMTSFAINDPRRTPQ